MAGSTRELLAVCAGQGWAEGDWSTPVDVGRRAGVRDRLGTGRPGGTLTVTVLQPVGDGVRPVRHGRSSQRTPAVDGWMVVAGVLPEVRRLVAAARAGPVRFARGGPSGGRPERRRP